MRIKTGSLITDFSGKIGGNVIGRNNGQLVLKNKSVSNKSPTLKQSHQRQTTDYLRKQFSTLTEFQRNNFLLVSKLYSKTDVFGASIRFTAFGIFQLLNSGLVQLGLPIQLNPVGYDVPNPPVQIPVNLTSSAILLQQTGIKSTDYVCIYASPALSKGTSNPRKFLRKLGCYTATQLNSGIDIITEYSATFGTPITTKNTFFGFKTFSGITGFSNGSIVIAKANTTVAPITLADANIRLLVGNALSPQSSDIALFNIMQPLVNSITYVSDEDSGNLPYLDITVVSESVNSGLTSALKNQNTPVITCEGGNFDELQLASFGGDTQNIDQADIRNTHPILQGVATPFFYNSPASNTRQGAMFNTGATNPNKFLVNTAAGSQYCVIAYDTNDVLQDSTLAVNKRVFIAGYNPQNWSPQTQLIFINALNWSFNTL